MRLRPSRPSPSRRLAPLQFPCGVPQGAYSIRKWGALLTRSWASRYSSCSSAEGSGSNPSRKRIHIRVHGGEGGIRTLEAVISRLRDFQSRSFGQLGHLSVQKTFAPGRIRPANDFLSKYMAEREGFEPSVRFYPYNRLAGGCLQPTRPPLPRDVFPGDRFLAEGAGFEPAGRCRPAVFKTAALNRSAIPPRNSYIYQIRSPRWVKNGILGRHGLRIV